MTPPATDWKEQIADDETERFARQAQQIRAVHGGKNARWGKGRLLHRKTLLAARARLTVADGLPEFARHGLFAQPGDHEAVVRLSHGSFDLRANTKPDIRGFAVKVLDVTGPAALGGTTDHQDFLFINHDSFASRTSDEFLDLTLTVATKGELGLLMHYVRHLGLAAGLKRIGQVAAVLGKPFPGYNAETFSTAVPIAVGPYAGKVRLRPLAPVARTSQDPGADLADQLAKGPVAYEVAVQFFTDEATTPIENPPVVWPQDLSPFVPVATLTLTGLGADVEALAFDPWGGLAAHRPLGEIMRARKGAYYLSQQARKQG